MRKQIRTAKKFVADHKVAIAITATSIVWFNINRTAMVQHNEFLKQHNLYEAFYNPYNEV